MAVEPVIEALAADGCFAPTSLDNPVGQGGLTTLGDLLPSDDQDLRALEARLMLRPVLLTLNDDRTSANDVRRDPEPARDLTRCAVDPITLVTAD